MTKRTVKTADYKDWCNSDVVVLVAVIVLQLRHKHIAVRVIRSVQLLAEIFDGFLEADLQRYSRLPIQYFLSARDVRFAALRVVFNGRHRLDLTGFAADQIANDHSEF